MKRAKNIYGMLVAQWTLLNLSGGEYLSRRALFMEFQETFFQRILESAGLMSDPWGVLVFQLHCLEPDLLPELWPYEQA